MSGRGTVVAQCEELARFLRARRDQVQPEDVGLLRRPRRRVQGLRREEVAAIASVSVTWYTWLEQGRDIHVSASSIDAICRALRLDDTEWRYVRHLAGHPVAEAYDEPVAASPVLEALLDELCPNPACIISGSYDLLGWNDGYAAIFGDPLALAERHRNLMWMALHSEELRARVVDWQESSRAGIAFFRADIASRPEDGRVRALVDELSTSSADFREVWTRHEVRGAPGLTLVIRHPQVGALRVRIVILLSPDDPASRLIVLHACDEVSRQRLAGLTP